MRIYSTRLLFVCLFLVCALCPLSVSAQKRPVTVADAIEMTKLGDPAYYSGADSLDRVAVFSPDNKKFIVVLRKGSLKDNTNRYSLLQWTIPHNWENPANWRVAKPTLLLEWASFSNQPAIQDVIWLSDNRTILFLGQNLVENSQIFRFDTLTRRITQLTHSPTTIHAYSASANGSELAYVAASRWRSIWDKKTLREGLVVHTHLAGELREDAAFPQDLILSRKGWSFRGLEFESDLFLQTSQGIRKLATAGRLISRNVHFAISPDGKYVLIETVAPAIPDSWSIYTSAIIRKQIESARYLGLSTLRTLELIETRADANHRVWGCPIEPLGFGPRISWSPDSRSAAVAGVFLPLTNSHGEDDNKKSRSYVVEFGIPQLSFSKIAPEDLTFRRQDSRGRLLFAEAGNSEAAQNASSPLIAYARKGRRWQEEPIAEVEPDRPTITLDEGMNEAPRIYVKTSPSSPKRLLLDLNPQFSELKFAKVEEIHWKSANGQSAEGGLYYPVDFREGMKYPLVIQTHLWNNRKFWIDGPWTTSYAAQPLAGKGIMVLQMGESYGSGLEKGDVLKEVQDVLGRYEGAIDYLSGRGLIDRERVGLIGFSHTCFHVKYALTHSKYHFAAASVAEGEDGGYLQFITANNWYVNSDLLEGGDPFGSNLAKWLELAPGFNLDKVHTPFRITALRPRYLLGDWEWFAGLSRLRKPVEMILLRDADHILQRPWERIVSQQGSVDWFSFWLNGEEDADPTKAGQYKRWRELRKLQEQKEKKISSTSK